ncbi:phage holin family protein [Nonomuraea sp. NPDC050556]|uniref:phage holin family protein n=1 Tax=Nonomuraea sp. NPDC050556 TaxID=3364369 RepID=UPI0037939621
MNDERKEHLSTVELIGRLSDEVRRLVKDELHLARLELAEKGRHAGFGAGLFGAAVVAAFLGGAALVATVILLLALVMPAWAAAGIVAGALLVVAAILALVGKNQVRQAAPPMPEETVESVKADIDVVKERARR